MFGGPFLKAGEDCGDALFVFGVSFDAACSLGEEWVVVGEHMD